MEKQIAFLFIVLNFFLPFPQSHAKALFVKDTLKQPHVIYLNSKPAPQIIKIPLAGTLGSYTLKNAKGELKVNELSPPLIKLLPIAVKNQAGAAPDQSPANTGFFTTYTSDNGLALDVITCSLIDKNENIWLGTSGGGVSRYDGKSFTNFTTAQGLVNNSVLCITEDKKGNIWFGTYGGGVSKYDGKSFTNFTTAQGLADNTVWSIMADKMENLWFGTGFKGVSKFDGKSFTTFTTVQGLANNSVVSMVEDKMGNLWFGTEVGGVSKYAGNSFITFTTDQGLVNNTVRSIFEDKTGNLWFGTDGGVSKYSVPSLSAGQPSFTNFTLAQGLVNEVVLSIKEDKKGNLWFGTSGGGLSKYDGQFFTNFTTAQGLPNNTISSISEDRSGNMWLATYGGGLCKYEGSSFINFNTSSGLANNSVWSITEDRVGDIWFGTGGGGISKFNGKSFTNLTNAQGLSNNVVLSITEDKNGNLWFGTYGAGVIKYEGKSLPNGQASFTTFSITQGLINNTIFCITEDKTGNFWFGTESGVSKFDGSTFTNFTTSQGLTNNTVRCMLQDKAGNLWFGTSGGGISKYDGKAFTNYTTSQGLANNTVKCITEDKFGNLWFGTSGGGISRYDGKSFVNYSSEQGIPDNTVTQIVKANKQTLAIGTNFGIGVITCFISHSKKGKSNDTVPAQNPLSNYDLKNYTPVIEVFNTTTGYPIRDVNAGQHSMFLDSKGIIWIGTGSDKTALVRFDYSALNRNPSPPKVVIQSLKINNSSICWHNLESANPQNKKLKQTDSTAVSPSVLEEVTTYGRVLSDAERFTMHQKFGDIKFEGITPFYPLPENLVLPHQHNSITFDFTAIEPARSSQMLYQYMLEGYDNDWSPITNKTTATYGNIYEGFYTFKLKAQFTGAAMSGARGWSEITTHTFTVLPPFYRHWFAYTFYILFLVSFVLLLIWWNGRRLRARAIELVEEVRKATSAIVEQKKIVEKKNKNITDSITYARYIQQSILMEESEIQKYFSDFFIYYQPKDIVSGDFYWFSSPSPTLPKGEGAALSQAMWQGDNVAVNSPPKGELEGAPIIIAAIDCTGHGVPGAFMSMIGNTLLNQIVNEKHVTKPSEILRLLNIAVYETLHQKKEEALSHDGMDISICCIDYKNKLLQFAGARNPLYLLSDGEIEVVKGDIHEIGGGSILVRTHDPLKIEYTNHVFSIKQNMSIYLFSDGYMDQFGAPTNDMTNAGVSERKKFGIQNFKELILRIQNLDMQKQKEVFATTHTDWKGTNPQIDDILVMGIKF